MPALDHEPHELFAHIVARGNTPLTAARAVGGFPVSQAQAEALARQPRVAQRIAELTPLLNEYTRGYARRDIDRCLP